MFDWRALYSRVSGSIVTLCFLAGLLILACSSFPPSPLEISQVDLGAAYDVYVADGFAFVSNNEGIAILSVHDLDEPREVFTIREDAGAGSVAGFHVSGDSLLVYGGQLTIYDVTNPADPQSLATYAANGFVAGARMQGYFAYVSYLQGDVEAIDFSDPANPTSVAYVESSGQINDLAIGGHIMYVANSSIGLELYDLSDPTSPQRLGVVPETSGAWDLFIDGNRLYLGCHMHGVKVIDIEDRSEPIVLGSFNNGGETYGVHALGNRLFTVDLVQGVEVLDVSVPEQPSLSGTDAHYHPHDLYSDGRYLYIADQDRHFVVLPLELSGAL